MEQINMLISLLSGIVGGNIAGLMMKEKDLGWIGNSIIGFFGGGIGAAILKALIGLSHTGSVAVQGAATGAPGLDIGSIIGDIISGGIGGGALLAIVSLLKNAFEKTRGE